MRRHIVLLTNHENHSIFVSFRASISKILSLEQL
jgi:hypothetical protein